MAQVLNNVKPKQGEDGFGSFAGKRTKRTFARFVSLLKLIQNPIARDSKR
jgi:hypothetical protein